MPLVGQNTGLENFNWGAPPSDQGSIGGTSGAYAQGGQAGGEYETEDSGSSSDGYMDTSKMSAMLQLQKTREDFQRMVKQARFFLPRTLQGISDQSAAAGNYWSSGRRAQQQEASKKTYFDLAQAQADAEFATQQTMLQMQDGRSSG
jgi:hypothetical protein